MSKDLEWNQSTPMNIAPLNINVDKTNFMLPSVAAYYLYGEEPKPLEQLSKEEVRSRIIDDADYAAAGIGTLSTMIAFNIPAVTDGGTLKIMLMMACFAVVTGFPTHQLVYYFRKKRLKYHLLEGIIDFKNNRDKAVEDVNSDTGYARFVEAAHQTSTIEDKMLVNQIFKNGLEPSKLNNVVNKMRNVSSMGQMLTITSDYRSDVQDEL